MANPETIDKDQEPTIWNRLRTPPPDAIKPIMGGPLKGKSDINPQWRWEALTEVFGPIGDGWMFEIASTERVPVTATGETMLFVVARMRYRLPAPLGSLHEKGEWSEWIIGQGGSMLIEGDKNGLHGNDEAYKMAVTDALGNAAKYLGLGADVFRGRMDGAKYAREAQREAPAAPQGARAPAQARRAQQQPARPTGRQVPPGAEPATCPNCKGPCWDNRSSKRYPADPDWTCKDKKGCFMSNGGYQGTSMWLKDADYRVAAWAGSQQRTIPEDEALPIDGPPPGWDPARDGFEAPDDVPY